MEQPQQRVASAEEDDRQLAADVLEHVAQVPEESRTQRTPKRPTGVLSAVVVTPPTELWPPIQALRSQHDPACERWMPHINLLYPFVLDEFFAEAADELTSALASFQPFKLRFEGFREFHHTKSNTLWLEPQTEPPRALLDLQDRLLGVYRYCSNQARKTPAGFVPHLTIGQFKSLKETLAMKEKLQTSWEPIEFVVKEIYLISRTKDDPFEIRHVVPFAWDESRGSYAPHFVAHPIPEKSVAALPTAHVNDIPSHFTGEDLGAVFREKGFLVVSATVVVDKQGQKAKTKTKTKAKNRVYGVVEFPTVEERQRAKVALNKTIVGDRRITIAIRDNKATT